MVNIDKLRGVIKEKRETIGSVAKAIGINCATFYRKMSKYTKLFTFYKKTKTNFSNNQLLKLFFCIPFAYLFYDF